MSCGCCRCVTNGESLGSSSPLDRDISFASVAVGGWVGGWMRHSHIQFSSCNDRNGAMVRSNFGVSDLKLVHLSATIEIAYVFATVRLNNHLDMAPRPVAVPQTTL